MVGDHVFGAVIGHRAAISDANGPGALARTGLRVDARARQVPLAILMVFLTALTLWSLGQGLVHQTAAAVAGLAVGG